MNKISNRIVPAITTVLMLVIFPVLLESTNPTITKAQNLIVQSFDPVKGWGNLQMGMSINETEQVLHQANIPFKDSRERIRKPGPIYFSFQQDGSDITVYFDNENEELRINQITIITETQSESQARKVVEKMQFQYGKAEEVKQGYSDTTRTDTDYIWKNQVTKLTLTLAHYLPSDRWVVFTNYSLPDPSHF